MTRSPFVALCLPILWLFLACHSDRLVAPLAIRTAAPKTPLASRSELARGAVEAFREALYAARFEALPEVQHRLTAAYLENPRDPEIALLVAHSHLWALSERSRLGAPDPRVTDHALLAERYFGEASALAPEDARIDGWQGGVRLALGDIHQDERRTREGYFQLRHAARAYPAFNGFSAAFPLSSQPRESARFAEAVTLLERNLVACVGKADAKRALDTATIRARATDSGPLRVCWNTDRVPHNFEGFFLTLGDVRTKAGDEEGARRAYRTAQQAPEYAAWRYRPVLEARLAALPERVAAFGAATSPAEEPEMMFGSDYACTGCHAR